VTKSADRAAPSSYSHTVDWEVKLEAEVVDGLE
jgi:hypothetical protein